MLGSWAWVDFSMFELGWEGLGRMGRIFGMGVVV